MNHLEKDQLLKFLLKHEPDATVEIYVKEVKAFELREYTKTFRNKAVQDANKKAPETKRQDIHG
jgi:hypothetical protein